MRESSPYRDSGEKTSEISHEERARIVDEMMNGREARAKERERRRGALLRPTFKLSAGVSLAFGVALAIGNEPRLVSTFGVLAILGFGSALVVVWGTRVRPP